MTISNNSTSRNIGTSLVGVGALAFGVWGLAKPDTYAARMGVDRKVARGLGARDLVSGLLIVTGRRSSAPFVLRALFDFGDAAWMAQRKPKVAIGAAAFGVLALALSRR
jgi:hypothetical protein